MVVFFVMFDLALTEIFAVAFNEVFTEVFAVLFWTTSTVTFLRTVAFCWGSAADDLFFYC